MTELRHLGVQPFTRRWAVAPESNRSCFVGNSPVGRVDRDGRMWSGVSHLPPVEVNEGDPDSQASTWSISELLNGPGTQAESMAGRALEASILAPPPGNTITVIPLADSPAAAKPYVCSTCGKAFKRRYDNEKHMRIHSGEKPFACEAEGCGKTFSQRSSLTSHMRMHTGERPYACKLEGCDKTFSYQGSLTAHMKAHTGERPYACTSEGCGKTFSERAKVKSHMQIHASIIKDSCEFPGCYIQFSRENNKRGHERKFHPGWQRPK
jgi:insecticidal toxin complex protein TccC